MSRFFFHFLFIQILMERCLKVFQIIYFLSSHLSLYLFKRLLECFKNVFYYILIHLIIKAYQQHRFFWFSLAIHPSQPTLMFLCAIGHRTSFMSFFTPTTVPSMSCSSYLNDQQAGRLSGHTVAVLLSTSSRICLEWHTASLCSSNLDFSRSVSVKSKWFNPTVVLTWLQIEKITKYEWIKALGYTWFLLCLCLGAMDHFLYCACSLTIFNSH